MPPMVNSGTGWALSGSRLPLRGVKQDVNHERYMGMQAGTPVQTSVVDISIAVYNTAWTFRAYTLALIATTLMMPAPAALFRSYVSQITSL